MTDAIRSAEGIAQQTLLGNIAERRWKGRACRVLLTGGGKYFELWARDSAAAMSALPAEQREVWRDTLEAFIDHQRLDGLFPRKLGGFSNAERNLRSRLAHHGIVLPTPASLGPEYRTVGYAGRSRLLRRMSTRLFLGTAGEPKDTNPLLLLSMAQYARGDEGFLVRHLAAVRLALAYLERHTRDGLLWQEDHEDWLDVYGRRGHVLYTNALYFASLLALARALRRHDRALAAALVRRARGVRACLQGLWDEETGHFASHRDETATYPQFATDGNMLAILTGIADARQRRSILGHLERIVEAYGYVPIVTPGYPVGMQSGMRRLFVWKYRDGRLLKPWLQSLAARAAAAEKPDLAARLVSDVGRIFQKHGCCEVIDGDTGKPHEFFITRTEKRFTAAAALCLQAISVIVPR